MDISAFVADLTAKTEDLTKTKIELTASTAKVTTLEATITEQTATIADLNTQLEASKAADVAGITAGRDGCRCPDGCRQDRPDEGRRARCPAPHGSCRTDGPQAGRHCHSMIVERVNIVRGVYLSKLD